VSDVPAGTQDDAKRAEDREQCPGCARFRKKLEAAEEREQMLCEGMDILAQELRWYKEQERARKRRRARR
jgi:hypothetical protein